MDDTEKPAIVLIEWEDFYLSARRTIFSLGYLIKTTNTHYVIISTHIVNSNDPVTEVAANTVHSGSEHYDGRRAIRKEFVKSISYLIVKPE